jgi:hypothetical protein
MSAARKACQQDLTCAVFDGVLEESTPLLALLY